MIFRKRPAMAWSFIVALQLVCSTTGAADLEPYFDRHDDSSPRFDRDIAPLLKLRCVKCHGPAKQEGALDLSTAVAVARGGQSGAAVRSRNLDASELWVRLAENDMPPDEPLDEDELELVKNWISQGAQGLPAASEDGTSPTDHWSFRLLQKVAVPKVDGEANCRNDIDRFLQAKLESRGLNLGPKADRSTLIRRVSFDVTGLPPTAEERAAFLSDSNERAYERMVEGYLSSLRYGERWGKQWLDVAGYAESNGYFDTDSERPLAYRYRDYVIRSINADKPFDLFIREQLAGDEMANIEPGSEPTRESIELLEATHFLRNAQDGTAESDGNPNEIMRDRRAVLDATVEIFGSVLFGLTLQCAKCHDHKYESITQRDYYALQAVLAPAFDIDNWLAPPHRYILAGTRAETAAVTEAVQQGRVTEAARPDKISAVLDVSATPPDVFILHRGEVALPGAKVNPSGPLVLMSSENGFPRAEPNGQSSGNRLAFAHWLTNPDGKPAALLARLQVNRIWQSYFGTGLVATPSNLGYSGAPPTHPELLEWLADQLVSSGWSTKAIHRLILNSATYRQSSAPSPEALERDPDNRLLWRMPLRRLDAESIYDGLLSLTFELDPTMGGPATATFRMNAGEVIVREKQPGANRRSVYLQQRRTQIPTMLEVFDAPSLVTNCVERHQSTVPMQSLALLNSTFMLTRAANLAKRVALEAGDDNDERIVRAFLLTLAREPDIEELRGSLQFIRKQTQHYKSISTVPVRQAWTDFCHSLIASNAFLYIE